MREIIGVSVRQSCYVCVCVVVSQHLIVVVLYTYLCMSLVCGSACAFCSLAQMTLRNCSLSGALSLHIIVTKGGGPEKRFIPPTYAPSLSF